MKSIHLIHTTENMALPEQGKSLFAQETIAATAPSHISELDGLRAFAALGVMAFHGWQGGAFHGLPLADTWSRIMVFGQTGVDLFFVLSGFLITRILLATRNATGYYRNFYGRRTLRIFPLYYAFLLIYCYILPLIQKIEVIPLELNWWFWAYLQNIPLTFPGLSMDGPRHYWSLGVEEHFYLLWPLVVRSLNARSLPLFCYAAIIGTLVARGIMIFFLDLSVFYFSPCRLDGLAMGALLACWETHYGLMRFRQWFFVALIALLPALAGVWLFTSGDGAALVQLLKFTFISGFYAALLGWVVSSSASPWVSIIFCNKYVRHIGRISYGLYVYHGACFALTTWVGTSFGLPIYGLIAGTVAALFVSHFSFRYFESYFLRFKTNFQ